MSLPNKDAATLVTLAAATSGTVSVGSPLNKRILISNNGASPAVIGPTTPATLTNGIYFAAGQELDLSADDFPTLVTGALYGFSTAGTTLYVDTATITE